jgi:transcription antitermination factor NusG
MKTIRKKYYELQPGDKVKLPKPNGEKFIGTVEQVDRCDKSFTVKESYFDFYMPTVLVVEEATQATK